MLLSCSEVGGLKVENKMEETISRWQEHNKKIEEFHAEFLASVDKIQDPECARALVALSCFTETCFLRDSELTRAGITALYNNQIQLEKLIKKASES